MLDNIFPKFSFSNKLWFCPDIFSRFLFGQPLPIFVVLNFLKESRCENACCFFILDLMLLWSQVQQKHPDKKSVGDFQSWESNRGQQWLSRTDQIKICQGFCWGQNFDSFLREKIRPFWSHIQWRGQPVGKTEIWPLWSAAAGDKEVVWLQKTNQGLHTRRIPFWWKLRPFSFQ